MERRTEDEIDELTRYETDGVGIGGTRRVGTVRASRKELRRHFGEPSNGYPKTTYHWSVRFPDGTVATIYDYRQSNRHASEDETVKWSVGGQNSDAIELLSFLGLDVS
jgi:hypothetical protein